MDNLETIKAKVNSFFRNTSYLANVQRWDADFDAFRLVPYNAGKNYYSFTTNRPRLVVNKGISMLTDAKLIIRVPESNLLPTEFRGVASNIERLCYGMLNLIDLRMSYLPMSPSLRGQLAWYACVRGTAVARAYVFKNDKGETIADIAPWDIYNVAYWTDAEGISLGVNRRVITKEEAKSRFNYDAPAKLLTIYDCWDKTDNGIFCDARWLKEPTPHGASHCPIFIVGAGSTPVVSRTGFTDTQQYQGESILAENRDLYPAINKSMSDYLTIVRRGVMVPLGFWSSGGDKTLDIDIWQVEQGTTVPLDSDRDEKIAPLITPSMPADALPLMSWLQAEEERGGFSPLALGQINLNSRMSGYAINNLQSATAMKIIPYVECLNRIYRASLVSLLEQYKAKPWNPLKVWGRSSRNQVFGTPRPISISPDDIEVDWNVEVELTPVFPKDDAQRYELARLATQGEKPLLSVKGAQEQIIQVEDPDLENEHISDEWANALPLVRLLKAYQAAVVDNDTVKAETILAEVRRIMTALYGTGAQAGGQAPVEGQATAPQEMFRRTAGAGIPSGATELSPEVLPPETLGGVSSGVTNATGV